MTDILVRRKIWKRCDSGSQISGYLASGIQIASEGYIYFRTKETQLAPDQGSEFTKGVHQGFVNIW